MVSKPLIGVNYLPCTTQERSDAEGMLTPDFGLLNPVVGYPGLTPLPFGQFSPSYCRQELTLLRQLGFNNIRFYGSFAAWLADRRDYLENLTTLVRICKGLGLTITYKLWSLGAGPWLFVALAAGIAKRLSLKSALQDATNEVLAPQGRLDAPRARGSHYFRVSFTVPDPYLALEPLSRWTRIVEPYLHHYQERPLPLLDTIRTYLDDVESVFRAPGAGGVLLSYDLFNEPELAVYDGTRRRFTRPVQSMVGFGELIKLCHDHIRRGRSATEPVNFTVGMAGPWVLVPFYLFLAELGVSLSYASFHFWGGPQKPLLNWGSAETWRSFLGGFKREAERTLSLSAPPYGVPRVVLSETYAPGLFPISGGNLGAIIAGARSAGVGLQLWAVLESNQFKRNPTASGGNVDRIWLPLDGLIRTLDTERGVYDPPTRLRVLPTPFFWRVRDIPTLLQWTGGVEPTYG